MMYNGFTDSRWRVEDIVTNINEWASTSTWSVNSGNTVSKSEFEIDDSIFSKYISAFVNYSDASSSEDEIEPVSTDEMFNILEGE